MHTIIPKYKLFIYLSIIVLVFFTSGLLIGRELIVKSKEFIYWQKDNIIITTVKEMEKKDINLPLPEPSQITTEKNKIRLDLEKISINRFFIIYSVIYGNQSHTAYHLYLTDLNKNKLDKSAVGEIYLKTQDDKIIKPVALEPTIKDFPEDEPLEWKIKIIAKFPYKTERNVHSLILFYQGKEFKLTGIYY